MKKNMINANHATITTEQYEQEKQSRRDTMDRLLSRPLNIENYTKPRHDETVIKASKATAYRNKAGRNKFNRTKPAAFNALIFKANHDIPTLICNEFKRPHLTKGRALTPEEQTRLFERNLAAEFEGTTLPGLSDRLNAKGEPWNYYTLARKAVWGKLTEDMRAERMPIFTANYMDMLQSGIAAILDPERVAKTVTRMKVKYPELPDKELLLRSYFRTATNGVKNWIDSNSNGYYRIAVNEQTGQAMTKDEAKQAREARSAHYADSKYEPEIIDVYEDDEQIVTVYDYHAPMERYNQRVATVNQDETYKASTAFTESSELSGDAAELELKIALLQLDLKALLVKDADYEIAVKLLNGQIEPKAWKALKYQRRERIHEAFKACLA